MFDIHTHILPNIDDGSSSVDESLSMLRELYSQGVGLAVATPHFYPDENSPERFMRKRREAWEKLIPLLEADMPKIRLGAEVKWYDGIDRKEAISRFCIEGTDLLLVEMPFYRWTDRMIQSLFELKRKYGITVVLAHIERYVTYQPHCIWKRLASNGILLQVSAGAFDSLLGRRRYLKMLSEGTVTFIGTDCHNMHTRRPNMAQAEKIIARHLGSDFLEGLYKKEAEWLNESEKTAYFGADSIARGGIGSYHGGKASQKA